jgi:hypothetical protein
VRKVLGSTQRKLVIQFLTESFIITIPWQSCWRLPLCELALIFFREFVPAGVAAQHRGVDYFLY